MDYSSLTKAADLCECSYDNKWISDNIKSSYLVKVDLYWVGNPIAAFVEYETLDNEQERAYVVFRGTLPLKGGNWLFANFQAHKMKFGPAEYPKNGSIHMGFYRAFYWLWNGGEPFKWPEHDRLRQQLFLVRHIVMMSIVYFLMETGIWSSWAWFCWAGLLLVETGAIENAFKKKPAVVENELAAHMARFAKCDEVVFTGHSLGGAMATLAFDTYREWSLKEASGIQNSVLVTFGCPHIGDSKMIADFEKKHHLRFKHFVHTGDPVPEVPCGLRHATKLFLTRGVIVPLILCVIGLIRLFYALLYWQKAPSKWSDDGVFKLGSSRLGLGLNHRMKIYKKKVAELREFELKSS